MVSFYKPSASRKPTFGLVHGSLVTVQLLFGSGSVIASLALPACNPFAFALYREIAAGLLLLLAGILVHHYSNREDHDEGTTLLSATDDAPLSLKLLSNSTNNNKTDTSEAAPNHPPLSTPPEIKVHSQENTRNGKWVWLPWHFATPTNASSSSNLMRLAVLGFMIFGNQAFFIVGIKLAGPVSAAVWQPSQPIITAAICMLLRWEPFQQRRVLGVFMAFLGCATMVVLSSKQVKKAEVNAVGTDNGEDIPDALNVLHHVLGNIFFFINCLCTSLFVILSKPALQVYPALFVTAWSYNIAAATMAVVAWMAAQSPEMMNLVCSDCATSFWVIPKGAYFALVYFIVFNSVLAYAVLTWANQYATGTLVMGYTVLQPVTASALTMMLILLSIYPSCLDQSLFQENNAGAVEAATSQPCLEQPGMGTILGMIGVFCGLYFVVSTEPPNNPGPLSPISLPTTDKKQDGIALSVTQNTLLKRSTSKTIPAETLQVY